jgi:hypothetical protein
MVTTNEATAPASASSQPAAAVPRVSAWRPSISAFLQMPPKVAVPFLLCNLGGILILFACMTEGATALILLAAVVLSLGSLVAAIIREVVAESSRNRRLSR